MGSVTSELPLQRTPLADAAETGLKIVVVGGFGVGKTTLVRSVSEIRPLNTEEVMTQAGQGVDETTGVEQKTTTTVAFDFGRISLNQHMVLYLFGAPGQERFWFLWDRLFSGTLGAVVLVDTRRMEDSWYAIDRLEHHRTPFVVAVNRFDGDDRRFSLDEIRQSLALGEHVPMIDCDARLRSSCKEVLICLVDHLYALALSQEGTP
ncbi:ATP/GTP-binding protein [Streptomyces longwoodensis]|uniref:GTP-binding protein n=1 Tax=Streptomyces longwoodensis TaxID=68231 RepID=UPI00224D7889|nr:ATP/GTP-binding protein [Streptomyces longwoodensis]MCX4996505.1 ATP/GTP-binding protein [Streptomyces longwoodensis]WRY91193.1 ATP/GTP-binding protein [Streptomyces longwoodensis]WTI44514.1 ATP/GTP-binding protein [Streptomyces longwoodensis]WUC57310.1 ATP/GTP-binding protein [Streptomyces longwoodensis]WUC70810.1 ATP/GTP-binding protein [Streptomyces longwoodensis]